MSKLDLSKEGTNITVNSVHPGLIMTSLMRPSAFLMWAATTCYVALHPSFKGVTGKYYYDCNEHKPSKLARDDALAKNLWDFSNLINSSLKT
ncbi:hypothetical protein H5410_044361 [Solanum commersonii]|uniref:Uncharacterized protein n=1 Tax=Solanum commersonii TaxID=4109 RepID=A0A9J5X8A0_SOLCO|nr:hypothetical protein H5410_044361 [Solanum commersonii]